MTSDTIKSIWLICAISIAFIIGIAFLPGAVAGDSGSDRKFLDEWLATRALMEQELAAQGRTSLDIESPKWYEIPYSTIGRMPVIDTCLRQPLVQPEIALWADEQARAGAESLYSLFKLAYELSEETVYPFSDPQPARTPPEWVEPVLQKLESAKLPGDVRQAAQLLIKTLAAANRLRDEAFADLTQAERLKVIELLPAYFVRQTPAGEMIRGYTTNLDECIELIDLLSGVHFAKLFEAAALMAHSADEAASLLKHAADQKTHEFDAPLLFAADTPAGKIAIAGTSKNTYTDDYALVIDMGGDDLYLNHPASTALDGRGAAFHFDLSGDDIYIADKYAQGSAMTGVAVFMDFEGDDQYSSGHYSQGAALCGYSFFYEGGGDDIYNGDLGVQCFSVFGASIFSERSGRDTYRCSAMGQGSASTLGVAILAEGGEDDTYRAGGKYGFYMTWDSSCAQGAASGMRQWPPTGTITVYGGVGFLSETSGNDSYHAYNIGQGGSYVFALGMLVDSEGNDTYSSKNYCRGVGVHLSAAAAIDKAGDDLHNGLYGQNGYSLDRSSGVFVDFAGNDTYRTSGGIGFGHKPKGCGIFVDFEGDDTYAGWENNYGKADVPFGDDAFSTGFFYDFAGKDNYPAGKYSNNSIWEEGKFGYARDSEEQPNNTRGIDAWKPEIPPAVEGTNHSDKGMNRITEVLDAPLALGRLEGLKAIRMNLVEGMDAICVIAATSGQSQQRTLIDLVETLITTKKLNEDHGIRLALLLDAGNYDMRLLGLNAMRQLKIDDQEIMTKTALLAQKDDSYEVRAMACLTLGVCKWEHALPALTAGLHDANWQVRRRAAMGLSELGKRESYDVLAEALEHDSSFQVRGYAVQALGRLKMKKAMPLLQKASSDSSEFVRAMAARALLLDFEKKEALSYLIGLLDWPNAPMKEQWVYKLLTNFTGKSFPATKGDWEIWWKESSNSFKMNLSSKVYEDILKAQELKDTGKESDAIALYRKIHNKFKTHEGVSKDFAELLNSVAWEIAVSGKNLDSGMKLAKESVDSYAYPMNMDTLSVFYFLKGDKTNADRMILAAINQAPEAERQQYEERRREFSNNSVNLR